ncbi:uncharacterized protein [Dysidea avara]|uniref:uncharacterized protein n=1 Tax=Dysidea avara TaxID=196820 RepID=UPI00331B64E7
MRLFSWTAVVVIVFTSAVCGIPTGGKFHKDVVIPVDSKINKTTTLINLVLQKDGTVCIKATASPGIFFAIEINVYEYEYASIWVMLGGLDTTSSLLWSVWRQQLVTGPYLEPRYC